eukprot:Gb_13556 [translate_table: standard]
MLACIACSKRLNDSLDEPEDDGSGTPRSPATKEAIKHLTAQIKDMALKFSGAYRHCKPACTSSNLYREGQRRCIESDAASEGGTPRAGSSNSTPAWNIFSTNKGHVLGDRLHTQSTRNGASKMDNIVTDRIQNASRPFSMEEEPQEWIAQVEPGVLITLVSLKEGGNDLKRIRFSREIFNKWQAQRWWTENYDKVLELYNVHRHTKHESAALPTPPRSEDEKDTKMESGGDSPVTPPLHNMNLLPRGFCRPTDTCRTSSSRDADRSDDLQSSENLSMSNSSEQEQQEQEWVEEDEPGVYITLRCLPGGSREVRRVRFSREKFSEMQARLWWEENRLRIHEQYISAHPM